MRVIHANSPQTKGRIEMPIKPMAHKETRELDAKGLPGTKIPDEAQRLIQLYNK